MKSHLPGKFFLSSPVVWLFFLGAAQVVDAVVVATQIQLQLQRLLMLV